MTLLINIKEVFLANILMMKKNQVKWKHTWLAEIKFNVINHPIQRDSDKEGVFRRSRGQELRTFSLVFKSTFLLRE